MPRRALVVRAGALGDLLLLRPAIQVLRRGGYAVTLLAPARSGSVLVGPHEADALIDWERADLAPLLAGAGPAGALGAALAAFDVALVASRQDGVAETLRRVVPKVVQHDPAPPAGLHAATWLTVAALEVGGSPFATLTPLAFSTGEVRAAQGYRDRLPARFLAVHAGSGSAQKNWPAGRFAQLAAQLADGAPFLAIEGPAEGAGAQALRDAPGALLARDLPLRVLGALLQQAGLYVGNDSGVSHLAAASGAPTLALFGPTDPAQWAPVGAQVRTLRAPAGTLEALPLHEVGAAAERLWRP